MAILSDPNRTALHALLMEDLSRERASVGALTKAEIRAAINATDAWIDSNAASFNTALPVAVRNTLTAKQKLWLFLYVAKRRFEVG